VTALAVAFELGLFAAAVVISRLLGRPSLTAFSPSGTGLLLGLAATLPLAVILLALRRSSWAPVARLRADADAHLLPLFRDCTLWQFAVIAAAAGLGEEMLFRGLLQGALTEFGGATVGLLGASVLFGLAHLITPTYALLAGIVGLYLGGLTIAGGGLWAPIVTHAVYDFVALAIWIRGGTAAVRTSSADT
jgi:membrane protease YdiL (CAAX protease family)